MGQRTLDRRLGRCSFTFRAKSIGILADRCSASDGNVSQPRKLTNRNRLSRSFMRLSACVYALLFVVPSIVSAAPAGTVAGTLVVSGKTIKLTHVYAIEQTTDTREKFYKIIFTDVAMTDKELTLFPDAQIESINAGKLHAMKLGLDNERKFYSAEVFTAGSTTSMNDTTRFELSKFDGKRIAGHLHLDKPYTEMDEKTYQFDLKFDTPLLPESDFLP